MTMTAPSIPAQVTRSSTTSVNADHSSAGLEARDFDSVLENHSGNRPDGPTVLGDALREKYQENLDLPLLDVQRAASDAGGVEIVTCGLCRKSSKTLQKGAEHMISVHLKLNLWYCDHCITRCARRWDLRRHRKDIHGIVEPKQSKSGRKLDAAAEPAHYTHDLPPDVGSSHMSVGPGPIRTERTRNRSRSPFNAEDGLNVAPPREDASRNNLRSNHENATFPFRHSEPRGRNIAVQNLFDRRGTSESALPHISLPPTSFEPSSGDGTHQWAPYQDISASPGVPTMGHASTAPIDLLEGATLYQTPNTQNPLVGPYDALNGSYSSQFLSVPNAGLACELWSRPAPIHHVTTPASSQPGVIHTPRYQQPVSSGSPMGASPYLSLASTPSASPQHVASTPLPFLDAFDGFYLNPVQLETFSRDLSDFDDLWELSEPTSDAPGSSTSPTQSASGSARSDLP